MPSLKSPVTAATAVVRAAVGRADLGVPEDSAALVDQEDLVARPAWGRAVMAAARVAIGAEATVGRAEDLVATVRAVEIGQASAVAVRVGAGRGKAIATVDRVGIR